MNPYGDKLRNEPRHTTWWQAVQVEELGLCPYVGPEDIPGHGAIEKSSFWPYSREDITDKWTTLPMKTGDDVVFFLPGVHKALIDFLKSINSTKNGVLKHSKPVTFRDARPMDHVLVPLDEVHDTLKYLRRHSGGSKQKVANYFWSVFPNFSSHEYKYSILVNSYDPDLPHASVRDPGWFQSLGTPIIPEIKVNEDIKDEEQRAKMYEVLKIFEGFQKEGCAMIEDWQFVTWNSP